MTQSDVTKKTVSFSFDGRRMEGIEGEPLARAIFRNGATTLSHSVKYHRPRGVSCARGRCVSCLVEADGRPGVKACITPLRAGMRVRRQGSSPFFAPLLTAAIRLLPFPAGFYFRFFTRPAFVRRAFLGTLRRMAGVARIATGPDEQAPAEMSRLRLPATDERVVVVGAGVSGMSAALAAAGDGADTVLIDAYGHLGGHALGFQTDPSRAGRRDALIDKVARHDCVTVLAQTAVHGFYDDGMLVAGPGKGIGLVRFRARSIVFATGSSDAPPLFGNNDTPGIFGAQAIRLLLERDEWKPGRHAMVYGTRAEVEATAALLRHHGIDVGVLALYETGAAANAEGSQVVPGARLRSVHGGRWVAGARIDTASGVVRVAGDMLCIATPTQPTFDLPHQAGFRYRLSDPRDPFAVLLPTTDRIERDDVRCYLAGSAAGVQGWNEKIEQAAAIGRIAATRGATRHHG